jgi:hypothetical protein
MHGTVIGGVSSPTKNDVLAKIAGSSLIPPLALLFSRLHAMAEHAGHGKPKNTQSSIGNSKPPPLPRRLPGRRLFPHPKPLYSISMMIGRCGNRNRCKAKPACCCASRKSGRRQTMNHCYVIIGIDSPGWPDQIGCSVEGIPRVVYGKNNVPTSPKVTML